MRDTSYDTYQEIRDKGLLSHMRWVVYDTLYHHGPLTGAELNKRLAIGGGEHYHKRLSELRDMGVAREVTTRLCRITKRKAIAWDVANGLPQPIKRKSRTEIIRELEAENNRLKLRLVNAERQLHTLPALEKKPKRAQLKLL